MTKLAFFPFISAIVASLVASMMPAQAQLARTFVSAAVGSDANDCNRLTPCRTFQHAHDSTLANGEITVLDPGGYGAVTIARTISIINDGVGEAGVLVSGGATAITINAGVNDRISLRGLTIKGIGFGGGNGITFNAGRSLTVENCAIRNLDGNGVGSGIGFAPNASSLLVVSNTFVADNSGHGIFVAPTGSGIVDVVFTRVEVHNSGGVGFFIIGNNSSGTINATAVDSIAADNAADSGFRADSSSATTQFMIARSVAANNFNGLDARGPKATLRVGESTVTGNRVSWQTASAVLRSYGDNNIDGNFDGNPLPPTTPGK